MRINTCNLRLRHCPHPEQGELFQVSWKGKVKAHRKGPAGGDGMASPQGRRGAGPPLPPPERQWLLALASACPHSWEVAGLGAGRKKGKRHSRCRTVGGAGFQASQQVSFSTGSRWKEF